MSWTKTVTLWCDGEDCYAWVEPGDSTVVEARQSAASWAFRAGRDLCPECK